MNAKLSLSSLVIVCFVLSSSCVHKSNPIVLIPILHGYETFSICMVSNLLHIFYPLSFCFHFFSLRPFFFGSNTPQPTQHHPTQLQQPKSTTESTGTSRWTAEAKSSNRRTGTNWPSVRPARPRCPIVPTTTRCPERAKRARTTYPVRRPVPGTAP